MHCSPQPPSPVKSSSVTTQRTAVILLHGLWMGRWACLWLAYALRRSGFDPYLFSYHSMRCDLNENADRLAEFMTSIGETSHIHRTTHLVGHSLGGLIALRCLERHALRQFGRTVLIGSPVQGSLSASRIACWPIGKILGKSILGWLRDAQSFKIDKQEIGIIAGSRGIGLGCVVVPDLPKPHDGVVCVAETQLSGAQHLVLDVNHSGMLISSRVSNAVVSFLRYGTFHDA